MLQLQQLATMQNDEARQLGAKLQDQYHVKLVYGVGAEVAPGTSNVYTIQSANDSSALEAPTKAVLKQQMGRGLQVSCSAAALCTAS